MGTCLDPALAQEEAIRPVGGRLRFFYRNWEKISHDPWILDTVLGCKVDLSSNPHQNREPHAPSLEADKAEALNMELEKLQDKEAIEPTSQGPLTYVSPMFVVPKSDGSWRPVINLQHLNKHVRTEHFKMESIRSAKGLIQRGDWMAKLDLKDAYLAVPLLPAHRSLFSFNWKGKLWRFKTLPFGLSSAPLIFNKLMKPVVALMRKLAIQVILYLDDMLIMAQREAEIKGCLATALEILTALGFVINLPKSVTTPTQEMEFLGFQLDSRAMVISLPQRKMKSLRQAALQLKNQKQVSVRALARLLGMMVAAHPAVLPAPLYYRHLERARSLALQQGLTYESIIEVNQEMEPDLDWWIHQAQLHNGRPLQILHCDLTIETDASKVGWGACCNQIKTGGPWTLEEKQKHINFLELLAVFLAIKSFVSDQRQINILLRIDNITAIAFLNRMGGSHSLPLSELAIAIWQWCLEREITLHAEHLPGSENVRADWESRHVQDSSDWMLHKGVFQQLHNQLGPFTIDLFASRTNAQLPVYCSWRPDPAAFTVDALSLSWKGHLPYLFPPFALITRCIQKIQEEESNAVLIAPVWHNQLWYPLILECLSDYPILLPPIPKILTGPVGEDHPMVLEGILPLATWPISGDPLLQKGFQRGLSTSSAAHGGPQLRHPIHQPGGLGIAGALDGVSIPFLLL